MGGGVVFGQESSGDADHSGAGGADRNSADVADRNGAFGADRLGAGGPGPVPDLLWVESVSERLLGAGAPTRPWEQAYFAADEDVDGASAAAPNARSMEPAAAGASSRSATTGHVPPSLVGRTAEGRPLLDLTIEEQQQIRAAMASAENELSAPQSLDVAGRALRLALSDPELPLSGAVLSLLAERAYDRARLQRLQTAVDVLIEQVPAAQAALLQQLLHGS
jgi:Spy/CpxP family protein refolding chaperone